jgi:hypothetical protein
MVSDKTRKRGQHHSAATIAKCKALYVVKGLGRKEICERMNVSEDAFSNWTSRYGWTEEKRQRATRLEKTALARATDENASFLESMATQAEELAEDGMQMAREHVQSSSEFAARNFQSATQGVKNVVDVYFRARGIAVFNIQSVFVRAEPAEREEKRVVDLDKVEHPQVKP